MLALIRLRHQTLHKNHAARIGRGQAPCPRPDRAETAPGPRRTRLTLPTSICSLNLHFHCVFLHFFHASNLLFFSAPSTSLCFPTLFTNSLTHSHFLTYFLTSLLTPWLTHTHLLPLTHSHTLTCLHPYLLTHWHTNLLPALLPYLLTYFLPYLLTYLRTYVLTYLLTYLLAYLLTYLLTYFLQRALSHNLLHFSYHGNSSKLPLIRVRPQGS